MAYNLNLDMSNMFGVKKKKDDDKLLGNVSASPPEELASGPTGNVQPQPTQPMSDPDYQTATGLETEDPNDPPVASPGNLPADWLANEVNKDVNIPAGEGHISASEIVYQPGDTMPAGSTTPGEELANNPLIGTDDLPQSYPEDAPQPQGPWTYEQTYIDPYIESIRGRGETTLGGVDVTAADVTQASGYGLQEESRLAQQQNLEMLQTLASGEPSRAIEAQRERGMQAAMATAASMRGAPTSAVQRAMNQQMAEVNRQAMEAGAQQQLQAQGMVNEFANQMRAQDMSIVDIQANFQQQANLTDAQMEAERINAQASINAQVEAARDAKLNELIGMGVDRNVAMLQISNDMAKLERELNYKYWAGKTGSIVEMSKIIAEQKGETEDLHEQFQEEAGVFNIFGRYGVPEGYSAPDILIDEGQGEGYEPTPYAQSFDEGGAPGAGGEYVWNFDTQQYDWVSADSPPGSSVQYDEWGEIEGSPQNLRNIANDLANTASQIEAMHGANSDEAREARRQADEAAAAADAAEAQNEEVSGAEAKQNITPIGRKDEFGRTRQADPFGQMSYSPELRGTLDPTDPNSRIGQMRSTGAMGPGITDYRKLGEARPGLLPSYEASQQKLSTALDASRNKAESFGKGYEGGKSAVRDYMDYGTLGYLGGQLVSSDKDEREKASKQLIGLGVARTIQGGVQGVEAFFKAADASQSAINAAVGGIYGSNIRALSPELASAVPGPAGADVAETINQVAEGVESAVTSEGTGALQTLGATTEAVTEGAAKAATGAAPYAPYIGGAVQFGSEIASGGEIAPALVKAGGATAGGVAGAYGGGALGGALGSVFPGIGTAIGAGVGSAVGGAAGAMTGGAVAAPLARQLGSMRYKKGQTPLGAISDPSELIGAPSIYSGFETKLPDTIQGVSDNIAPHYTPSSSALSGHRTGMAGPYTKYGIDYENSGAETKSNAGPVQNDDLANFLRDLNPVKYDYKPEFGGEKGQYGFIAQDAKFNGDGSINPVGNTIVRQDSDGTHKIDTGKATMVNMAASANQQQAIDEQGLLIAELLKRQAMLEGRA